MSQCGCLRHGSFRLDLSVVFSDKCCVCVFVAARTSERMSLEIAYALALGWGRTLVLPPHCGNYCLYIYNV